MKIFDWIFRRDERRRERHMQEIRSAITRRDVSEDIFLPPGTDVFPVIARGFGHTMAILNEELPAFSATQIQSDWTCRYCAAVNPPGDVHCGHCGAPHREWPQ